MRGAAAARCVRGFLAHRAAVSCALLFYIASSLGAQLAAPVQLLPAPRPFPPGRALVPQAMKLAPADAELWLDGRRIETKPGPGGCVYASLPPGEQVLYLLAAGYGPARLRLRVPSSTLVQAKLERIPSMLRLELSAATGERPKSVAFSPDGRFLVVPLMSGAGADLLDALTLAYAGRLDPPKEFIGFQGFVECAFVPGLREIWISQMHTDRIHIFDLDTMAYKESVRAGGVCPKVIAISPDDSRAYVSNWVSESVTIIDVATRKIEARVLTRTVPRGLAPTSDGAYLYIAGFGDGSIMRLRLEGMALEIFHPADGGAKRHIVLDEVRGRLYATDMTRDSLFAFDIASRRALAEIHLGPNPNGCALNPDGSLVFACTRGTNGSKGYEFAGPDFGELIAIDAESLSVVDRQWGGNQPTGLAVSPDGSRLAMTEFLDHKVEVYSLDGR